MNLFNHHNHGVGILKHARHLKTSWFSYGSCIALWLSLDSFLPTLAV